MTAALAAVSPASQVEQIGAYLGYAAVIGLGVLALLYFAQARELKRLRDWVGDAPERGVSPTAAAEPRRVVAQPIAPATVAAQQAAAPPPATLPPAGQLARSASPAAAPAAGQPAPAATAAGRSAPAAPAVPVTSGTVVAGPVATPVAAAAAHLAAARSAAANGTLNQETAESAAARPEPPAPPAYEPAEDDRSSLSYGRAGLLAGGGLLAVLVAVVLVLVMTGDDPAPAPNDFGNTPAARTTDETSSSSSSSGSPSGSGSSSGLTTADRRATTVTVLNGTTQTGLARTVSDRISKADFKVEPPATNADQSVPATVVSYVSGKQRAALAVAKVIDVDSSAVQPADATTAAASDVVVVIGADKIG